MKPFEGLAAPINSDLSILFYRATYEHIAKSPISFPEVLIAEVQSNDKMPFADFTNEDIHDDRTLFTYIDRYLRDFLNLVTGEPNYPFNVATRSPYDEKQLVKIFYRIPGFDPDAHRRVEVSFTVAHQFIESRFASLLKTWIEKSRDLRSACDLYFKRYYLSTIDVELSLYSWFKLSRHIIEHSIFVMMSTCYPTTLSL